MERTETVILTNMCMICDAKGNVLVEDRVDPGWQGIAFPGGHVEWHEPFTDAIIREVKEETGLTVSDLELCGLKDWIREDGIRYVVCLYRTGTFSGTLRSSAEGEVYWVPLSDLPNLPLSSGMRGTLQLYADRYLSEQFFQKEENGSWRGILK